MGRNGIPCIGFGPGAEAQAHAPNEKTWKDDLVRCAAVYAALPTASVSYTHLYNTVSSLQDLVIIWLIL